MTGQSIGHGPSISFVIPALNEEKLLGRCISSIKAEIERANVDAEIIVVDNGSTDATPLVALVKRTILVTEPKRGLLRAKAAGFAKSRGPIVAFIDADSMLRAGWITHALRHFADQRVVAVSGPYHYYDLPVGKHVASAVFALMGALNPVMPMMMGGNSVFRRDAIVAMGGFDTSLTFWGEDAKSAVEMRKLGKVVFDPRMKVASSGRRLKGQGYLSTFGAYMLNYAAVRFTGAPAMQRQTDYR